jgi:hypothetical protein
VCKNVEGVWYLVSDFNLKCYADSEGGEWGEVAQWSVIFMFVYPLGVPLFFYKKLKEYAYGKTGTNRLDQKGVRCQIGFLYDGFERRVWWFELVDMLHKLMATSLISFFPLEFQLPMAMVLMTIYLQVLLYVNPYVRKGDDALHLVSQVELILMMMAGNVFEKQPEYDPLMDVVLSVVMIAMISGFFIWWFVGVYKVIKKTVQMARIGTGTHKVKMFFKCKEYKEHASSLHSGSGYTIVGSKMTQDRVDITSNKMRAKLLAIGRVKSTRHQEVHIHQNPLVARKGLVDTDHYKDDELRVFHYEGVLNVDAHKKAKEKAQIKKELAEAAGDYVTRQLAMQEIEQEEGREALDAQDALAQASKEEHHHGNHAHNFQDEMAAPVDAV